MSFNLTMDFSAYSQQVNDWPKSGKHILAQYDSESVIVYQAYRPSIGRFAAENGYFGGEFKLGRMTWIKPNFLWMMFRCGWASKTDQETVLAIRLKRDAFETVLAEAVHSSFQQHLYPSREEWKQQVAESNVRLQWDPDHDPEGSKLERRAIQLGLRGERSVSYSKEWLLGVEDITNFVVEQRGNAVRAKWDQLVVPTERVYMPSCSETIAKLELAQSQV